MTHVADILASMRQILVHLEPLATGGGAPDAPAAAQGQPRPEHAPVFLEDLTNWAEGVTAGITAVIDKALLTREAHFLGEVSAAILSQYDRNMDPAHAP
jgi:hypothetical protein